MRKEILIPDNLIADLKMVAFAANKSVKKYMEDLVKADIKKQAKILRLEFP